MEILFAERLRELRDENNVDIATLAKAVGVGCSQVRKWEKGKHLPKIDNLCNIADYFDTTLNYLVGLSDVG